MFNQIFIIMLLVSISNILSIDTRPMGEPGKVYIVNASAVNVRQKPSTTGAKVGSLTKGQKVFFIEEKELEEVVIDAIQAPWVKIKTEDGKLTGWIFGGYLVNDLGDTNPALGYNCIDFKKTPLSDFKGGCGDRSANGAVEGAGECKVEFSEDKKLSFRLGTRTRVNGKWEVQGNKIIGSITENSREILCNEWRANEEDCIKDHMNEFGKKDAIILNYKVEFTPNPSKNSLVLKVNNVKDPNPKLIKKTFKSTLENKEISCVMTN